ncbi:MAG: flagellar hook-length control protein FliK [Methylophaga sp.]
MNAPLTIKTEVAASKPANESAKATPANDNNGFSQALEKQVQDNGKAETDRSSRAQKNAEHQESRDNNARKSDQAAVTASEDGKKLPPAGDNDKAVKAEDGEQTAESTDKATNSTETKTDDNAPSSETVTVNVAAPAIEKSATEKVTMTLSSNAKAQPKSVIAGDDAPYKAVIQNLTPVLNAEGDIKTVDIDGKTRFADILKKDGAAQSAIRADILQAISQKTSSDDSNGQTLKTSLQNLLLNADNKPQANAQVAELIRQIQPGQQRSTDNRTPAGLVTALTPAASAPGQASAASTPQIAMDVQPQLNSAAWSRVVSSRVVWMAREGVQQAELRLNPANLGSVDVRLNINNDQASVTFLAQNAATREALEQAMPRLRESLAENGLSLTHSEVGQQDHSDQQASEDETSMQNGHLAQVSVPLDDTEDELVTGMPTEVNEPSTGVSLYA